MIDNYSHIDNTVIYIPESIPGPKELSSEYDKLIDDYNSQITHHCDCESCSHECPCFMTNSRVHYPLSYKENSVHSVENEIKGLEKPINFESMISLLECNDFCNCSDNCGYRKVQKGPIQNLFIKICDSEFKGCGLFTKTFIPKGHFICEYAGEIITETEAVKRHSFNSFNNKMNYIFCVKEIVYNKIIQTIVDPSTFGNIGRYINHSCEPNSIIIPVRVNCMIPKIAIFSCSDIHPYTEITFNYGSDNKFDIGLLPTNVSNRKLCLCNTSKCKGFLPFDP